MKRKRINGAWGYRSAFFCVFLSVWSLGLSENAQARDLYLQWGGSNTSPYLTPETAANSITSVLSVAINGDTIHIADGVWTNSSASSMLVTNGVVLLGDNGPGAVVLQFTGSIGMTHPDSELSGLSVVFTANTYLNVVTGKVTNCWIRDKKTSKRFPALYIGPGGLVTDSKIYNNATIAGTEKHSGIVMTGGILQNSIISNNTTAADSSGIYLQSGTPLVRNCLIVKNASTTWPGAGINIAKSVVARIESCTVANNTSPASACGGIYSAATTAGELKHSISNCIISGNVQGTMVADTGGAWAGNTNAYSFSCAPELIPSVNGNLASDPIFRAAVSSNYRLLAASPCLDAGSNQLWMATGKDLDGLDRMAAFSNPAVTNVDMGCYERGASQPGDPLECAFVYSPNVGRTSVEVTLTPRVAGGDVDLTWYGFDFENDGIWDVTQSGQPLPSSVTRTLAIGSYPITMSVSNVSGQQATWTIPSPLAVHPTTYYLSLTGSITAPYDTLAKAARSFDSLITYALGAGESETIYVDMADGIHTNSASTQVQKALYIRGVNGPSNVTLCIGGNNHNYLGLSAGAVLDGVTLTETADGILGYGLLVISTGATVTNCIVRNYSGYGSVINNAGVLTHSSIYSNTGTQGSETLGLIYVSGLVSDCRIFNNSSKKAGGAIQLTGSGVVRNSLIYGNTAVGTGGAACMRLAPVPGPGWNPARLPGISARWASPAAAYSTAQPLWPVPIPLFMVIAGRMVPQPMSVEIRIVTVIPVRRN